MSVKNNLNYLYMSALEEFEKSFNELFEEQIRVFRELCEYKSELETEEKEERQEKLKEAIEKHFNKLFVLGEQTSYVNKKRKELKFK